MLFPRGHCQTGRRRQPHLAVIRELLLMLALLMTPIKTTTGRGAGQELMDLLKLEITFIARWIYRQRRLPSLSLSKGQLRRIFLSLLAGPQSSPRHRLWLNVQNIRVISLISISRPFLHIRVISLFKNPFHWFVCFFFFTCIPSVVIGIDLTQGIDKEPWLLPGLTSFMCFVERQSVPDVFVDSLYWCLFLLCVVWVALDF